MLRHRAVGDSEAPEQDSNIVYGFHLIPIYNRAQFLDKTDPCRSMSRRQGRVRTGAAIECHMECHQDITPETPSLAPAGAAHACLCLTLGMQCLGMQCLGDAVTTMLLDRYQTDRA